MANVSAPGALHTVTVLRRSASSQIAKAVAAGAAVLDLTSNGAQPWIQFSPFYPHRNIPVPMSAGTFTGCVEGAWQALKVFENEDVDLSRLRVVDMRNLKRSASAKRGKILGHRAGVDGTARLSYVEARKGIYLPLYRWVLENKLQSLVEDIRRLQATQPVVLLDYETNGNVEDPSSPLSHAALVKAYVERVWPEE
jgi:hypothetical protein